MRRPPTPTLTDNATDDLTDQPTDEAMRSAAGDARDDTAGSSRTRSRPARLLFVGDIHLGRRPTRLPGDLAEHGVDPAELTPAAAWLRTVELALRLAEEPEGLAAVVLAGDVVESLDDRFGAFPHLESGVARIAGARVPVYGVAGNHDVHALPRLADRLPAFHLLGRGGRWERVPASPGVELVGWSFPDRAVRESPLATGVWPDGAGAITLGVLHCDLDGGRSPYAPVARSELERTDADAWLLGHVHAPSALGGSRPIGYLGSLVGLDPGESGPHGPWLLEVDAAGGIRARHVPLAPLRWERATVVLEDGALAARGDDAAAVADALHDRCTAELYDVRERIGAASPSPKAVGVRLALEGATRFRETVRAFCGRPEDWPRLSQSGLHVFTEKVEDRTRPALDLQALARGTDPPALLARRLLAVERGDCDAELARRLAGVCEDPRYRAIAEEAPPEETLEIRGRALRVGLSALEALLTQRPAPESAP